jgi:MFS family permease
MSTIVARSHPLPQQTAIHGVQQMSEGALPLRRIYLLLCGSLAAQALGQSAMFAMLPTIGREVGVEEIQVGAMIAASSIVFFIASPLWGRAGDRFGRRRVFITGQLRYVLGGTLFAGSFWFALEGSLTPLIAWFAMIGARMTQATLRSASARAAGAYIADITSPGDRARGLARIGAANNLGSIAGPRSVSAEEQGAVAGISAACSSAGWIVWPALGPGLYQLAPALPFLVSAAMIAADTHHAFVRRESEPAVQEFRE